MRKLPTAAETIGDVDLDGKTMLVTGVNSGLGAETLRVLTGQGASVIGAARSLKKAVQACAPYGDRAIPLACELSDLNSVTSAAQTVISEHTKLDALIGNAGIMALPELQQKQGLELQFLCNHLGHYSLIRQLLPLLAEAEQGRIVLVSSEGHRLTVKGGINFDNLSGKAGYHDWRFYGQSKLANILTARALSKELANTQITANAAHPGVIRTNLSRSMRGPVSKAISFLASLAERSIAQGAATQVYLAAHPQASQYNGMYFVNSKPKPPSRFGTDTALAERLIQWSDNWLRERS